MDDLFITKKLKYTTLKKTIQHGSSMINYGTIDSLHTKFMTEFDKQNKNSNKNIIKLEKLKKELSDIEQKPPCEYMISDISKKSELKEKIEECEELIFKINSANDELDYFSRSLPILKDYYKNNNLRDINYIDKSNNSLYDTSNNNTSNNNTSNNNNEMSSSPSMVSTHGLSGVLNNTDNTDNTDNFNQLDLINQDDINDNESDIDSDLDLDSDSDDEFTPLNNQDNYNMHLELLEDKLEPTKQTLLDFFNTQKKNKEKNISSENDTMLAEFLKCTMNKNIKKKNIQIQRCPQCLIEKILQSSDGHMVCMNCGHSDQVIVDMEKINFKDPFYENKSTGYKRMNHFSELMNQFQAKESTDIPQKIFNNIILEIKKQKITNPNDLNKKRMRLILKKLELNQYFEHIPFIINRLTGLPPPTITRETEEKLKLMFKEIQEPFKKFRSKKRKNFLNYNYVFHKFFELLDMDQFLPHFPLLKSASKLREQDELWERICAYLKWEYIPST